MAILPRIPNWFMTHSGKYVRPFHPEQDVITVRDIAQGLGNLCRWKGQCPFFSVAQHSVIMTYHVPRDQRLAALFHDSGEAMLGIEIVTPIKSQVPHYEIEELAWAPHIQRAVGCGSWDTPEIHLADLRALITEARDLMPEGALPADIMESAEPFPDKINPWLPHHAGLLFMARFLELQRDLARVTV